MKYKLHPEAETDLSRAMDHYEEIRPGLEQEFRTEVEVVIHDLLHVTCAGPAIIADCRFRLPKRFPYIVLYRVRADTIQIIGVVHDKRDLSFIEKRLAD
ncbi:MAG: type II toxin-antitoxin system RelE/ParE family toxin [Planctomycetaceae bacterium]|nr:type II toxin-antitoxin system RelE/ParE family toxin [Planctomycetaceae bacterium]